MDDVILGQGYVRVNDTRNRGSGRASVYAGNSWNSKMIELHEVHGYGQLIYRKLPEPPLPEPPPKPEKPKRVKPVAPMPLFEGGAS